MVYYCLLLSIVLQSVLHSAMSLCCPSWLMLLIQFCCIQSSVLPRFLYAWSDIYDFWCCRLNFFKVFLFFCLYRFLCLHSWWSLLDLVSLLPEDVERINLEQILFLNPHEYCSRLLNSRKLAASNIKKVFYCFVNFSISSFCEN